MTQVNLIPTLEGLPNIAGFEDVVFERERAASPIYLPHSGIDFGSAECGFAMALHMHQPLIPAGGTDLGTAAVISNLKHMMDNQGVGDNHNAPVFQWCYKRMGEFIPQLVSEGKNPRIMLEYSGCLLHGLLDMGLTDVIDSLKTITCDDRYRHTVEWLGCPWGHAVAPSTPVQDFKLHVRAWQHHFASIFGVEALDRVRGFSPSEMALPNHPEVCYEFVKTLRDSGYRWVLVQEDSVENVGGGRVRDPHLPHRLVARNAAGDSAEIVAIIKTQGSDTKLVAQGQPYYEAKGVPRGELGGRAVPRVVTQIADGENGGVMMNEFPPKYLEVMRDSAGSRAPAVNVTEYLEYLEQLGVSDSDFEAIQPVHQHKIWARLEPGEGSEKLEQVITELKQQDHQFHMEGGSWTNDRSWVTGYDHVLRPMEEASALFNEKVLQKSHSTRELRYKNALFYLLVSETSCYRFWGEGVWTDYGRELSRRTIEIIQHDFAD